MRTFLFLIVLAAVAGAAWHWRGRLQTAWAGHHAPAVSVENSDTPIPGPAPAPAPASGGPPSTPVLVAAGNGFPAGAGADGGADPALPGDLKDTYAKAEALWNQVVATGAAPASSASAPVLDQLYSQVLIGTYKVPALRPFAARLVDERLTPLGTELFFTKTRFAEDPTGVMGVHVVAPGENPDGIARKLGMSRELLNRLRGHDSNDARLNVGERLKVVNVRQKGGFYLHVDKTAYWMDCFVGGDFIRRYPISDGAPQTPTPTGTTHLVDRVLNPTWTNPTTHEVFAADDPRNILGRVWLAFSPDGINQSGLGIHGYTGPNPRSQAMVSNGCIRMDTAQAQELYQTLSHPDRSPTVVDLAE